MELNPLQLILFAGIACGVGALLMGIRDLLRPRKSDAELARELRRLPKFAGKGGTEPGLASLDLWWERVLYQSGLKMNALEGTLLVVLVCLAAGGALFVLTENELLTAAAIAVAVGGTLTTILVYRYRRMKRFEEQFPAALDLLARAVRAGESLDQALYLVGDAIPDPVGPEFRQCAKQIELGLSLPLCMQALIQRLDLMDVAIFGNTLAVHREAGGNLPITLERLAEVIRDRAAYHRQLASVTSAGRFSAMLITLLGPVLFIYMFVFQPQYGGKLLADPLGRIMLVVAAVSQLVGLLWVSRLLKKDY